MNQAKITELLSFYKEHFYEIEAQEEYKWEAVQHFQNHWNIDAVDFHAMLEESIRKNHNLSASKRYNAGVGILMAAKYDPEGTRRLFRILFDESLDLIKRISNFKCSVHEIIKDCDGYKDLNKQDVRAIILYLFQKYPDKYYPYKLNMYRDFLNFIDEDYPQGNDIQKGVSFLNMCDEFKVIVLDDNQLMKMYTDRRKRYTFPTDNLLVQDIIYSVSYYNNPKLLKTVVKREGPKVMSTYVFEEPSDAMFGEFDSWQIINANTAIKQTDKFFYDYRGSGVPKEILWFFEASNLSKEDRLNILLEYNGYEYSAYLKRDASLGRMSILWNTEIGKLFREYLNKSDYYPLCMFQRTGKNKYAISFFAGQVKKYEEALDDSYTDEDRESHARQVDIESLKHIVEQRQKKEIEKREVTLTQFSRDPYIAEFAKRRAKGICQLCMKPAPFIKKNGEPYLETHHIIWLANGGEDSTENTVALCPNCHRKMHIINNVDDLNYLQSINKKEQ